MNIYDGKPSIDLGHRPFFTITIPCYNSKDKLPRLLESILIQNMADDIEIIICDDHSTEPYQEVVDAYKDKLCIRQVQTEYNFGPGNTREVAASYATGEWLTNCDHDDELLPDALTIVKQEILKNKEEYAVYSHFRQVYINDKGKVYKVEGVVKDALLTHGKFFNLDNLWRKYDIHYRKGLKTHEDIYVSKLVNGILDIIEHKPLWVNRYTYNFYQHSTSINSTRYRNAMYDGKRHVFIEVYYKDWCDANYTMYLLLYNMGLLRLGILVKNILELILFDYIFLQAFIYKREDYIKRNIVIAYHHLKYIDTTFYLKEDICVLIRRFIWDEMYKWSVKYVKIYVGYDFPMKYTLEEWIDYLKNYKK